MKVLVVNQYPPSACDLLITDGLNRILDGSEGEKGRNESFDPTNTLFYGTEVKHRIGSSRICRELIILANWMSFQPLGNLAGTYHLWRIQSPRTLARMWFIESHVLSLLPSMLAQQKDTFRKDAMCTRALLHRLRNI